MQILDHVGEKLDKMCLGTKRDSVTRFGEISPLRAEFCY